MTAEEIAARVWPGQNVRLEPLRGGITNHNFKVMRGSEAFVLRIAGADTKLLGIDREAEHAAAQAAAEVGVGPEVVDFVEGSLITRFVEGRPVPPDEIRRPACLAETAVLLRRVHEGPPFPAPFDSFRVVETYLRTAGAHDVEIPAEYETAKRRAEDRAGPRPAPRASLSQRPAQRQLHPQRRWDPHCRLGVRGHGRPLLRPSELLRQPRALSRRDRRTARGLLRRGAGRRPRAPPPDALHVRLPRGDVGRRAAGDLRAAGLRPRSFVSRSHRNPCVHAGSGLVGYRRLVYATFRGPATRCGENATDPSSVFQSVRLSPLLTGDARPYRRAR
jgi:hypothetical protein